MVLLALSMLACTAAASPQFSGPVEHVVLLMLENRAFDHMCGHFPNVDGLNGLQSNPVNTSNPFGKRLFTSKDAPYVAPFDPNHSTPPTTEKIYGEACLAQNPPCGKATMDGFVEFAINKRHKTLEQAKSLMQSFTPVRPFP